jgi:hypothetical protein
MGRKKQVEEEYRRPQLNRLRIQRGRHESEDRRTAKAGVMEYWNVGIMENGGRSRLRLWLCRAKEDSLLRPRLRRAKGDGRQYKGNTGRRESLKSLKPFKERENGKKDTGTWILGTSQTGRERAAPDRTIRSANSPA